MLFELLLIDFNVLKRSIGGTHFRGHGPLLRIPWNFVHGYSKNLIIEFYEAGASLPNGFPS